MSDREKQIEKMRQILELAKTAKRDTDDRFENLDFHIEVGDTLDEIGQLKLYELKDEVYPYLQDKFADFRLLAVKVLGWGNRLWLQEFKSQVREIWLKDDDEDVKVAAMSAWSGYNLNTQDPEIMKELYDVLISKQHSIIIRTYALHCIMKVAGTYLDAKECYQFLSLSEINEHDDFEKEVDWPRIEKVMRDCIPGWEKHP